MSKLDSNLELLKRIDEKNYLTEREHKEYNNELISEFERLEKQDKVFKLLKKYKDIEPSRYSMCSYLNGDCSYESFVKFSTRILDEDEEDLPTKEEFELLRNVFRK